MQLVILLIFFQFRVFVHLLHLIVDIINHLLLSLKLFSFLNLPNSNPIKLPYLLQGFYFHFLQYFLLLILVKYLFLFQFLLFWIQVENYFLLIDLFLFYIHLFHYFVTLFFVQLNLIVIWYLLIMYYYYHFEQLMPYFV